VRSAKGSKSGTTARETGRQNRSGVLLLSRSLLLSAARSILPVLAAHFVLPLQAKFFYTHL
jgi:hypothetical protein